MRTREASIKAQAARRCVEDWRAGRLDASTSEWASPDSRPGRPDRPLLRPPREVPKRSPASEAGRGALLHALAHIELNAIDLAFDTAARFAPAVALETGDLTSFIDDWMDVGDDEARHFLMLSDRMGELGCA
ncbi:MAG: DUF455 family protein, partial [Pseudomonadota bacterium]